ncbi:hypothetical protein [Streptomyces boncukensis]|uniref:Secreted protein n=1 Tax=Streptomyces boncukensis TaxID=2711219 RepID=A0A6G4X018_9ACTN|nr:hypothetical protein [Streptomyces boncukensis]NGO70886.1 hypothetical protein [Streptomyces boncukensis]
MLRRTTVAAVAAVALAVPLAAGCDDKDAGDAVGRALDCAKTALEVSDAVDDAQRAALEAAVKPDEADEPLDRVDENLKRVKDKTDDADVERIADKLGDAVDSMRKDVEADRKPDTRPLTEAADELTKICKN